MLFQAQIGSCQLSLDAAAEHCSCTSCGLGAARRRPVLTLVSGPRPLDAIDVRVLAAALGCGRTVRPRPAEGAKQLPVTGLPTPAGSPRRAEPDLHTVRDVDESPVRSCTAAVATSSPGYLGLTGR